MKAYLVLQDGTIYEGAALGAVGSAIGEVVFNTGMTGYQEILSDPSYAGQIVLLTYPLIGNYGVNADDFESSRVQPRALIVREACDVPSNWRSRETLDQFMKSKNVIGLKGIDTRALTKKMRSFGVMMGIVTSELDPDKALQTLLNSPGYGDCDFVQEVTTKEKFCWGIDGKEPFSLDKGNYKHYVAIMDFGTKYNIFRRLAAVGCRSLVYPCTSSAEEILESNPQGILLSPGPGDPARLDYVVKTVKKLLGKKPIMGICLGHQIIGQAMGAQTFKLKFGHRGSNHPVKDLSTNQVTITSQNHGYAVAPEGLSKDTNVTQINLNDGTVEGMENEALRFMTIQYHPEASPGPWDSRGFFSKFLTILDKF